MNDLPHNIGELPRGMVAQLAPNKNDGPHERQRKIKLIKRMLKLQRQQDKKTKLQACQRKAFEG